MANIRTKGLKQPVDVAEYLFHRLREVGVRSVHGLPGDYNLVMLDYIPKLGLQWVGSVNELNAAYAADGYARINGIGALVTTFGVGELSAINGIAGSFSEMIPVVHIVGCPSTKSQRDGMLMHHTLGNGDFNVFANMSAEISVEVAKLNHPAEIANQIDHVLRQCIILSRPVYIMVPSDIVTEKIEGERLNRPIDLEEAPNNLEMEDYVVDVVLKYLHAAQNPVILVDACAVRHKVLPEVVALIEKTQLPVFVTPMGKGAVDETYPTYGGVYAGLGSYPDVRQRVESSDLILSVGALKSDLNTTGFSIRNSRLKSIDFHSTHCLVRFSEYPGIKMRGVLRKVTQRVDLSQLTKTPSPVVENIIPSGANETPDIVASWLWPRVGQFLRENDVVITESGASNFGILETKFPRGVTLLNQVLWGSIGWSVPAAQGAAQALRDLGSNRRVVLFVGDGSFQLTAQEVSTMIRRGLKPIIFCICNDGYTVERFIHGMDAEYNDIAQWQYNELVTVFGGTKKTVRKLRVHTKDQLEALFMEKEFNAAEKLQFVEVYMPKHDLPAHFALVAKALAKNITEAT